MNDCLRFFGHKRSFWSHYNMRSDLTIFVPWLDLWVKVDVLGERGRGSAGRWQAICSMPRARRIGWLIAI